jgi:Mor family transcriptional regulator
MNVEQLVKDYQKIKSKPMIKDLLKKYGLENGYILEGIVKAVEDEETAVNIYKDYMEIKNGETVTELCKRYNITRQILHYTINQYLKKNEKLSA